MPGVGTIPGCPHYTVILSIQGSTDPGHLVSGQSRDVLSIPGYLVFKDPGIQDVGTIPGCPQYPGIFSIQGSRDPGHLVSGQSWDVLSIPGYLIFKDPVIQGVWF